jgi:phosphatidate cytidylyltransferase
MLRQRVITALLLIPLVVSGVLLLDNLLFGLVTAAVLLVGAYEMARLAGLTTRPAIGGFILAVAACLWLAWRYMQPQGVASLQWVMGGWWILMTVALVARRTELVRVDAVRPTVLLLAGLVLVTAWVSIVGLHASGPNGPALVLYLFVLIWVADSGAYFAGRAFGKTKLSPFVSPGKTWVGVLGALAGAILSSLALSYAGFAGHALPLELVMLSVLVTAVSIGGDLWESRLKREAGVKDSGDLLPGHGGMLDRIDSLLAAAPLFALGVDLIGATA